MKSKIEKTFKRLKREGKKAFIPYIMDRDKTLERIGVKFIP